MTTTMPETNRRRATRSVWWAINGLGLYVMLMYGITYYAITTSFPRIAGEFAVPVSTLFGLITIGLIVTAILAPYIGRLTDRLGASRIILFGAIARAIALTFMALAPDLWLFAIMALIVQLLGQLTEYDATFAAAVDLAGEEARKAMSQITLWGGLASTLSWPVTAFLLDRMSWRTMFLVDAAVILLVCVPVAVLLRQITWRKPERAAATTASAGAGPSRRGDGKRPSFALVAAAFAFGGVAYNLPYLMLPVLEGLGLGASAVLVGALFGPAQTAGRFCDMAIGGRVHAIIIALIASAIVAVSLGLLLAGGIWTGVIFALLFGAGAGVAYIARGSVVLALYGPAGYAAWLGRLSAVRLVVTALTPLLLSLVLENFGAREVVYLCIIAALLSLACFAILAVKET